MVKSLKRIIKIITLKNIWIINMFYLLQNFYKMMVTRVKVHFQIYLLKSLLYLFMQHQQTNYLLSGTSGTNGPSNKFIFRATYGNSVIVHKLLLRRGAQSVLDHTRFFIARLCRNVLRLRRQHFHRNQEL
jgi:hypothetical protein